MKRLTWGISLAAAAMMLGTTGDRVAAQNGGAPALVIQGGTLIDGNGGAPVPNSVIVIQGNRIAAVGPAGQTQIPAGARIIDARNKFVLPGLWDAQTNYSWFNGELNLNQGVTSIIDIGNGEELSILHREAVTHGKIRGPRTFVGIGHLGGANPDELTGLETALSTRQIPKTVDETVAVAKRLLDAGADMVMFHDGRNFTPEMVAAACREAHARGKVCTQRADGPKMKAKDAAIAGADQLPHARGIDLDIMRDGATPTNNVLERFAQMDDAKAKSLIDVLVREKTSPVPAIIHESPGYPKNWERMSAAVRKVFTDPDLRAYYPDAFYKETTRVHDAVDTGDVRQRRMVGYQNVLRFYRMLDAAGGKTVVGGDTNAQKVPGFVVHDEMEILEEAGIPRMHVIQGATKWAAEALNKQGELGSIEAGKLADILIVNADPLQDIGNLRNIDSVIMDGKVADRAFHSYYSTPFLGSVDDIRVVEALPFTVTLKAATFRAGNARQAPDPVESPQPAIQTISPIWAKEGDPAVTMKLTGFNFVRRSRVFFDGLSVPWRWVSPTELEVTIGADLLKRPGRYDIEIQNPQPVNLPDWGNGTSNKAHFMVDFRY
ncbi:MAG TPA: amidohydrolase family protein [Micropepsaceae bacterium]|nr:amidohydrolase family protein [Micropepsaceae bacterium]